MKQLTDCTGNPIPASPSGAGGPAVADGFESGVFPAGSGQGRRRTKCKYTFTQSLKLILSFKIE